MIFSLLANEKKTGREMEGRGGREEGREGGERGREGGAGDWAPKPQPLVVLFFFLANAERT